MGRLDLFAIIDPVCGLLYPRPPTRCRVRSHTSEGSLISNNLTGSEGLNAAMAIDDEGFGQLWQNDSVRAMRIATLLRVQSMIGLSGGTNALEICNDVNPDDVRDILSADEVRYRVRLGNWDSREIAFRWEQGHWKLARIDLRAPKSAVAPAAPPTKPGKPKPASKKK